MAHRSIGYEFLRNHLQLHVRPLDRVAQVFPMGRIVHTAKRIQVPASVAPRTDAPIDHLMFALKHEGVDLQHAILALKHISEDAVGQVFANSPTGIYARKAAYLWELAHGRTLSGLPPANGAYVALLDPNEYLTAAPATQVRNRRWRVIFNGIGDPSYSPYVRRTPEINALLAHQTLQRARAYADSLSASILESVVRWSSHSETEASFDIEHETPSASQINAFVIRLSGIRLPDPLTEQSLVALQQLAVSHTERKASAFRTAQNWLREGRSGAWSVTYVPPPPEHVPSLMANLLQLANTAQKAGVDPLVMGAIVGFGVVFVHPFMDGNGRLSRFLFHHLVNGSGLLPKGMVLPVSLAMKRHEDQYVAALKDFSKPARAAWEVSRTDGDRVELRFRGEPETFRYWDATEAVRFCLAMAQEALDTDLRAEGAFFGMYNRLYAAVNAVVDMSNNALVNLLLSALKNNGVIPSGRLQQLLSEGQPPKILRLAQQAIAQVYEADAVQERKARLERLPALRNQAGVAHILWQMASEAMALEDSSERVDWNAIHEAVVRRCLEEEGLPAAAVTGFLAQNSPGASTQAGEAAIKLLVDKACELTR